MRLPSISAPSVPSLRKRQPQIAVPIGKQFEIVLISSDRKDLTRKALKLIRTPGVTEVLISSESGRYAYWRVITSDPKVDLDWLGEPIPHVSPIYSKSKTKGSYSKTKRGTWRVAMELIPVKSEGLERARLIEYRGISGVSVWIVGDEVKVGFALEVSTPIDGTQICQLSLLTMASKIGVRCEIVPDPKFAALIESLSLVKG